MSGCVWWAYVVVFVAFGVLGAKPGAKKRPTPAPVSERDRTFEDWLSLDREVLELSCNAVNVDPVGSRHQLAQRLHDYYAVLAPSSESVTLPLVTQLSPPRGLQSDVVPSSSSDAPLFSSSANDWFVPPPPPPPPPPPSRGMSPPIWDVDVAPRSESARPTFPVSVDVTSSDTRSQPSRALGTRLRTSSSSSRVGRSSSLFVSGVSRSRSSSTVTATGSRARVSTSSSSSVPDQDNNMVTVARGELAELVRETVMQALRGIGGVGFGTASGVSASGATCTGGVSGGSVVSSVGSGVVQCVVGSVSSGSVVTCVAGSVGAAGVSQWPGSGHEGVVSFGGGQAGGAVGGLGVFGAGGVSGPAGQAHAQAVGQQVWPAAPQGPLFQPALRQPLAAQGFVHQGGPGAVSAHGALAGQVGGLAGDVDLSRWNLEAVASVPARFLHQIRRGEYVNFDSLFSAVTLGFSSRPEFTMSICQDEVLGFDSCPSFAIRPRQQGNARISSFVDWSRAWGDFYTASIIFRPHLAAPMVRYQTIIARFAATYPRAAWAAYDSAFRQAVANNPAIQWGVIHDELFDRHLRSATVLPPRSSRSSVTAARATGGAQAVGGLVDGQRVQPLCFVCSRPGHLARSCPHRLGFVPQPATPLPSPLASVRASAPSASSSVTPSPSPLVAPGMSTFRAPQRQRPTWCFAFNEARPCGPTCRWPHVCSKCFGTHPVYACDK